MVIVKALCLQCTQLQNWLVICCTNSNPWDSLDGSDCDEVAVDAVVLVLVLVVAVVEVVEVFSLVFVLDGIVWLSVGDDEDTESGGGGATVAAPIIRWCRSCVAKTLVRSNSSSRSVSLMQCSSLCVSLHKISVKSSFDIMEDDPRREKPPFSTTNLSSISLLRALWRITLSTELAVISLYTTTLFVCPIL